MTDVEISVNGGPPRSGSVEIEDDGRLLHWGGQVAGAHIHNRGLAHLSFSQGGRFYAGKAMFLSMMVPTPGSPGESVSRFHGCGPLDRFEMSEPPPTADEQAQVTAAIRAARGDAYGRGRDDEAAGNPIPAHDGSMSTMAEQEQPESIRVEVRYADRTQVYVLKPADGVSVRSQIDIERDAVEVPTTTSWRRFEPSRTIRLKLDATGGELAIERPTS